MRAICKRQDEIKGRLERGSPEIPPRFLGFFFLRSELSPGPSIGADAAHQFGVRKIGVLDFGTGHIAVLQISIAEIGAGEIDAV